MINLFNKLFCKHQYETIKEYKLEDPNYKNYIAGVAYILQCKKCGKIKKKKITF